MLMLLGWIIYIFKYSTFLAFCYIISLLREVFNLYLNRIKPVVKLSHAICHGNTVWEHEAEWLFIIQQNYRTNFKSLLGNMIVLRMVATYVLRFKKMSIPVLILCRLTFPLIACMAPYLFNEKTTPLLFAIIGLYTYTTV